MKATFSLSQKVLAAGQASTVDLLVRFQSEDDKTVRRPLNISLVLDRSGSMGGRKLAQAVKASQLLVDRLTEHDRLSIVTYDDKIRTEMEPQLVSDKKAVKAILGRIRAGGITNLSGGWLKGCDHVKAHSSEGVINRVLMLTDGQANMGITNHSELISMARTQADAGVATTTLGFGNGFNEDLLIGMADAGEGNFYFIQSPDDAAEVFNIEVEGLASLIASNLVVEVEAAGGASIANILNSYKYGSEGGKYTVSVGDVYAIEPRTLALELSIPALSAGTFDIASLSFKYGEATEGGFNDQSGSLTAAATVGTADESAAAGFNAEVFKETSKLRIGRAKEEAINLADKGDLKAASARLRTQIEDIKIKALDEEFEFAEEVDQLDHYANLFDKGGYNSNYRKEIRDQGYQARSRGRADLKLRGTTSGDTSKLDAVTFEDGKEEGGVIVHCVKQGGKLRVRVQSEGYDSSYNVQFPRALRQEGVRYLVETVEVAKNGGFYRASGAIKILLRPGESRPVVGYSSSRRRGPLKKAKAVSLADIPTTDDIGDGVLIQIVKAKKLRARVVSDGFDPDKNMRFPRAIRKEGVLFVVDDVKASADGSYYIAYGKIRRLVQPGDTS